MSKRNDWSVKNLKFCHRTRLRSDIERTVIKNAQRPVKVVTMIATSGSETSVLVCEWVVQVCGFEWIKHVFVCTSIGKSLSLCKHKGLGIGNNSFELRVSRSKGGWVRRLPWRWRIEQIHRRPTIDPWALHFLRCRSQNWHSRSVAPIRFWLLRHRGKTISSRSYVRAVFAKKC